MSESNTTQAARRKSTQGRYRPPTWRSLVLLLSFAAVAGVYLFVTAPPPLAAEREPAAHMVPMRTVFAMLERENDAARMLWTREIVERGKAVGLAFDEHWRDAGVHAGPLPALFLRETAQQLERTSMRLSLFLGSPAPINAANRFSGDQAQHFEALAQSRAPQHFVDPSTKLATAMFVDVAITSACASCHNEHADSPKTDWRVGDVMGATTWMYPESEVTTERAIELVRALRTSIRRAYASYLEEVATWPTQPSIGTAWPRDGLALPSEEIFMQELARRSAASPLLALVDGDDANLALDEEPAASSELGSAASDTTLVIRSARSTRVTIEHAGGRLLVARLAPGDVTTLSARLPLRVQLTEPLGVDIEYGGKKIAIPAPDENAGSNGVEVVIERSLAARNDEKS